MSLPQSVEDEWIACPRCRIANLASNIKCNSCGAVLDPNAPPPRPSTEPKHWVVFIGIITAIIGSAIWAGLRPDSIAASFYSNSVLIFYGVALLLGFARAFSRFRKGDISGGIIGCGLTILLALAMLPAVLDLDS